MINKIRTQLVQNAASILRSPIHLLPKFVQKKVLLDGLKMVFHEALEEGDFEFLNDKWLKVEIRDLDLRWYISYQQDRLLVADAPQQEDVSFSGNLNDLVLIAGRKEDPDTLFFQRRLSIEGDTELGLEVKNLMDSVDLQQLPQALQILLHQLADFVHKGMQMPNTHNEVENAYSN
ncbi:SCP2 domain-containing protein [Vibrio cincinnatiensis]|uniref:Ubiquinone biosynthesis accessory factor UbiT n=1 Tax=Vibrio cincinnatiensis DSM 19608 TaxID=1123491 RepID=A0A1T4PFR4_VIBCI|nr:SCP2 domain-containing protein [Vibrio cincinnatiensis]MCG3721673.1 SCP2 domain-containing protein [Vibrio cincinnatiensis]MCG3724592.1 SCP2 domain-containing protein [Vibrio cincinnatiensis]MCG3731523.1 SCP2 domain-containing protein [Vibrio cincinnatiensis]MCG3739218.1 SCP2 domain-containing protein [Vibrio cincinnatiensis]MCG3742602.1 SCP2 domain-containing protein [Vibrio cincinnatiensis]